MVSALCGAIRMAWVMSLVSVSSRTMSGLCRDSGILAGVALAAAWAWASRWCAVVTGASSLARAWLVMRVSRPGAGLRRAVSLASRAALAAARSFLAVFTAAAAVFLG